MNSQELRKSFVEYFKKQQHTPVDSSPLVPQGDATLLFANAGMNQFKNLFLGLEKRSYTRAVSVQKCVRAGGKHNDLENVGYTARHHTFFEMLGNFSFGDYFKKEAIHYAWDFLTNTLKIDKNRLYVTVHISDDEAADIWAEQEKIPRERIFRFDEDNFWRMGDVGPCGPCSEIFYDHFPVAGKLPSQLEFTEQSDRFVEIWNLVFMQYNEDATGRHPLPKPSVDTGAGLERLSAVMQGKYNNYDTDIFIELIQLACRNAKLDYSKLEKDQLVALRVLADHARTTGFLIAEGVLPSNEGRGYVLRRIMRRAIRYGQKVSKAESPFLFMCKAVIGNMGNVYPELKKQAGFIEKTVEDEINRFLQTLDHGTQILNEALEKLVSHKEKILSGEIVFKLYDTYGFPADLTRLMAQEKGFSVDEKGFERLSEQARTKAKASWKGQALSENSAHLIQLTQDVVKTEFTGYEKISDQGKILKLSDGHKAVESLKKGAGGFLIANRTCFYAESGGQVGDSGKIHSPSGEATVLDCTKHGEIFLHHLEVIRGELKISESAQFQVNEFSRAQTANHHSATHLLHSALREILGKHITQAGSLVAADRLRFDFTHNQPLSSEEIEKIEKWVNGEISAAAETNTTVTDPKTAIQQGAMALFGEKYGDKVRVVQMGPHSTELCGGTHVHNTSQIRLFKIMSEAGVSSGVRRIEALTGEQAIQFVLKQTKENQAARQVAGFQVPWSQYLDENQKKETVSDFIEAQKQEIRRLQKEMQSLKGGQIDIDSLIGSARYFTVENIKGRLLTAQIKLEDQKLLSDIIDKLKNKIGTGIVILVGQGEQTHPIIVSVSKDLIPVVTAKQLVTDIATEMGGRGGGRPDFAQGSVKDLSKLKQGFAQAEKLLGSFET